jgi:hypothetical protein
MQGGSPALEDATKRFARKAPPHPGCGEIVRSRARLRLVSLSRASCDHHDFTCNAIPGDLFSVSLRLRPTRIHLRVSPRVRSLCIRSTGKQSTKNRALRASA